MTLYQGNNCHADPLEVAHEYQDFIVEQSLEQLKISISLFQSKKYQFDKGESLQGVEIKYDARSTGDCTHYDNEATGNVAIEIAEKSSPEIKTWTPSGIYRRDNTWLYIIGNYHCAWVFQKSLLILLHKSKKYPTVQTKPTLKSMLLPVNMADKYCAKKMYFDQVTNE